MVFCELFEQNIRVAHAAWMFFLRPPPYYPLVNNL